MSDATLPSLTRTGDDPYLTLSLNAVDELHRQQRRILLRINILHALLSSEKDLNFREELADLVDDILTAAETSTVVLERGGQAATKGAA